MQYDEIQVPRKDLKLSPDNVRTTPPSPEVQAQFVASILAKGLIYPLLVKPTPRNGAKFHVVAGGRRLAAYQLLAEEGRERFGRAGWTCKRNRMSLRCQTTGRERRWASFSADHMNTVEPETASCLLTTVRGGYADAG